MSILLVLITFMLFITISYLRRKPETPTARKQYLSVASPAEPRMVREFGYEFPKGYAFHPGHTWVLDEGRRNALVGMDSFAANLLGKIDRIEVAPLNGWVRQGQRLWTVTHNGLSIDMLSPVEGIIAAVNTKVIQNPNLILEDPYKEGWILMIQSPELGLNLKNLIQGPVVRAWMQSTLDRMGTLIAPVVAPMAQDGGLPIAGLLRRMDPQLQRQMIREFFLS